MREPRANDPDTPRSSRLAGARSAYLRAAADQAIDWHPWGSEAFELARTLNRPVLLDIGAGWCHWCHVMDEGTYSDPQVARLIRENFVAVKVDRDENPEVDRRYQRQVGALTGEGGWPLTGFLSPSGEAFLGGTYFPPEDGRGRPGFRRVLSEVARWWKEEPEKVRENTENLRAALDRIHPQRGRGAGPVGDVRFVGRVGEHIDAIYDPVHAGFGSAPKFPHPTAVSLLLWIGFATGEKRPLDRAHETLLRMADGGMYDQLGGGFHRYSSDEAWHIPHFEKMGIDNAALLAAYVEGAQRFGDGRLTETVRGTRDWILGTLAEPQGGFGASQDADNAPGDDGRYFTWSRAELRSLLPQDEFQIVAAFFGLGTDGRMPHDPDQNVLYRLLSLSDLARGVGHAEREVSAGLAHALETMRSARARRRAPAVDRARYANINGPMIGALARAGLFLDDPTSLEAARSAADAFLGRAFDGERGVAHRLDTDAAHGFGLLEDNAGFAWGLVELSGACADARYLDAADRLLDLTIREFQGDGGLLKDIAPRLYDGPALGVVKEASYPLEDSPHLSGNAMVALALLRSAALSNRADRVAQARALLNALQPRLDGAGLFAAGTALASGLLLTSPARVVVQGSGSEAEALFRAAARAWHPNLWLFRSAPGPPFSLPEELDRSAAERGGVPRALVCFGTRCLAPVTDPAALGQAIGDADRPTL